MLIGRQSEKEILENFFKSEQAEFLAIYGRRRVGKTYLIKQFFANKKCIFLHATGLKDGDLSEQINLFVQSISNAFLKGLDVSPKKSKSWIDVFNYLNDAINMYASKNQKIVLFIDELPWMATRKSKLLQALDYFWNHYWSHDPRIKLIICGSSASWIINKVINNKGGLHNRVTKRILLMPFTLADTKKILISRGVKLNNWHISQIYMITGGIPFYLSYVMPGHSAAQVIENLAFTANSPLLNEFNNLFSSLFDDAGPYIELIRIIAASRYGVSVTDIINASESFSKGGRTGSRLQELKEAGFIMSFRPYKHKSKGIYYRVIDEYTLFYLYWIEQEKEMIQEGALIRGYWQSMQLSPAWHSWAGLAFESIVYKHLLLVRNKLNIPVSAISNSFRYLPAKHLNEDGVQIDLLFDRRDAVITLCEIKYTTEPFIIDKQYAQNLINKRNIFIKKTRTKKHIFICMIAANGIKNNTYSDDLITQTATLDDLFVLEPCQGLS